MGMIDRFTDEVRGGVTGHGVRYVLIVSMGLAIVAMAAVGIFFTG